VPTFKWESEAAQMAHVHCVIIGFSYQKTENDLNPYLLKAPTVFIESRNKPICNVPDLIWGNKPVDGGNLLLTEVERDELLNEEPDMSFCIRRLMGAEEYINKIDRFCLWLVDVNPLLINKSKIIMNRVKNVHSFRMNSTKKATQKCANTPTLFMENRQPDSDFIIIPSVSSEKRRYVPIGFLTKDIIVNNSVHILPNAEIYHFGILTSNVHMAWMRVVCGRLESRYRYSKDIVYNNFLWCEPNEKQKAKIEETAQKILDARTAYPESSLADLYGENMYLYP
jgi:hypothetical protein